MYVDDLCIIISSNFTATLHSIMECMLKFGKNSQLRLHLGKCVVVEKCNFSQANWKSIENYGLPLKMSIKYHLGVLIGHMTVARAFSKSRGEAERRASLMVSFLLSLIEIIQLLKVWVVPVLMRAATAYRASKQK